jgi:hypothetical protein
MKTDKTKLHQHRKARKLVHHTETSLPYASSSSELDMMLYRLERSPKQENL